jgi:hypothetical protein
VEPAPEIEEVLAEELGSSAPPPRERPEITIPPVPAQPAASGSAPAVTPSEVAEPLRISVPAGGGLAEVTVPVTVRLGDGQAAKQVGLSLKLLLDLRVQR